MFVDFYILFFFLVIILFFSRGKRRGGYLYKLLYIDGDFLNSVVGFLKRGVGYVMVDCLCERGFE
jgi:hypothetical protein